MSGREIVYRPPRPIGAPFRGDPHDRPVFPTEGSPASSSSAQIPPSADSGPYVLPPEGATAGQIPLSGPYSRQPLPGDEQPAGQAPVFTRPGAGPVSGPNAVPPTETERKARTALTIGVVSLLILHIPLGPIAIALGIKSIRAGERKVGAWAVSTGVAGTLIGVTAFVLWATGVLPTLDQLMQGDTK
ncbi:MAG: hypothetical protein HZB14_01715 [Actinobacteria bacterium]|nr:hypothetical protein [Actinomycetota bacterium]